MRSCVWAAAAAALLALAAAAVRRVDQDFEFDDDADAPAAEDGDAHSRRPRRYIYDPHNSLCRSLVCKKREVCVLRDAFTALCATKKDIIRNGDVIVTAGGATGEGAGVGAEAGAEAGADTDWGRDDDDDVFYDGGTRDDDLESDLDIEETKPDRCVGCPVRARAQFLCGSDNRTYSSLCRLDLHNCVRRAESAESAARPVAVAVALACRGFCPCAPRRRPAHPRPAHPRAHPRPHPAHPAHPHRAPRPPRPPRPPHPQRQRSNRRNFDEYDETRRRRLESAHNEVLPERSLHRRLSQGSEGCALDKMANRLLDWFSVLMDEAGAAPTPTPPDDGFPSDCKPEVRWMFAHLDTDGDGLLSAANLYSLRHDERERCLRPFLSSCGGAGGAGGAGGGEEGDSGEAEGVGAGGAGGADGVSRAAWCGCLRRAARPCTALARAHPNPRPGAYVPSCDAAGYYRARQCHAALGVCWCVDAHGVERAGSRTKGAPACPGDKAGAVGGEAEAGAGEGAEGAEGAPADDEDGAGSGEGELRF